MREVLPARHLDQALVTGAEFYAQYGVSAHKLIPFPQSWRLGFFYVLKAQPIALLGDLFLCPKLVCIFSLHKTPNCRPKRFRSQWCKAFLATNRPL